MERYVRYNNYVQYLLTLFRVSFRNYKEKYTIRIKKKKKNRGHQSSKWFQDTLQNHVINELYTCKHSNLLYCVVCANRCFYIGSKNYLFDHITRILNVKKFCSNFKGAMHPIKLSNGAYLVNSSRGD